MARRIVFRDAAKIERTLREPAKTEGGNGTDTAESAWRGGKNEGCSAKGIVKSHEPGPGFAEETESLRAHSGFGAKKASRSTLAARAVGKPACCAIQGKVASGVDVAFQCGSKGRDTWHMYGAEGGAGFKASGGILRGGKSGNEDDETY